MKLKLFPEKDRFMNLAKEGNVIPVCLEVLADTKTPVSALGKIADGADAVFLLESVEGKERWGRYSFLGASAHKEVLVFHDVVELRSKTTTERIPHAGDPLAVLRDVMADYSPVSILDLPRFWGGLVGYLTYEMVSFFEEIPLRVPRDRPLAHFILTDELLIFDNIRHTLTLVAHVFTGEEESMEKAYKKALKRLDDMLLRLSGPVRKRPGSNRQKENLVPVVSPDRFRADVNHIKERIIEGDIIQAVISQPFVLDDPPDSWNLYRASRYINPSPYMYFMRLGNLALVGSSPETMVRLEDGTATLRPIAGTRPRGAGEQEDRRLADELLKDPKERAEHLMLVDLGRNDLGRVAETGTVQVTELMIVERYSHVMHLVSNITCDLKKDVDAWDLIRATFPAGTLTGAPKVRAMEIIAELEQRPRGAYGGAVGYVSFTGNMDLAITIRTACIEDGQLVVQAGAGIVADSDPEKERVETLNKARAFKRAIELATLPDWER